MTDDATIRKCMGSARRWGYSGIRVFNLFACRATSPTDLSMAEDPIGPTNDKVIQQICRQDCIVAWGNHGVFRDRASEVLQILRGRPYCIGITTKGQPKHPARVGCSTPRRHWKSQDKTKTRHSRGQLSLSLAATFIAIMFKASVQGQKGR